jgi:hypothetical protein
VERLVNPRFHWTFEREASTVLWRLAWAWQSMRWRLLLAHAWSGWWTAALSATRRSAVDRRTATMLYASRDRSYSMRRWWPQNWGVHDGHCWSVGDSAGEDRFCCGGAPARRDGVGHRRADLAVTGIWGHGSVAGGHLGPQKAGQFAGHGGGHHGLDVLAGGQGRETLGETGLGGPGAGDGGRAGPMLALTDGRA